MPRLLHPIPHSYEPTAIRNNRCAHAKPTLFWEVLAPNGGADPCGALGDAIEATAR
jgi:Fe-Mn family superoxide dismutase